MAQQPVELILLRQWASYIASPIWITGNDGTLLFYNEPAEEILGRRYDEAGEINATALADLFVTEDLDGRPVPAEDLPLVVALTERIPSHKKLRVKSLDGQTRVLEVTAIPIEGQGARHLGALALFWEST